MMTVRLIHLPKVMDHLLDGWAGGIIVLEWVGPCISNRLWLKTNW